MGEITIGVSKKTQEAMEQSGVTPSKKPTDKTPTIASRLNEEGATQNKFTNKDLDNMTSSQFTKYLNLPEGKAKAKGGYVKKYAKGGGIRKARTYG